MLPFNQLTPAGAERLAVLAEELGEAVAVMGSALQAIGKVLRHGYEGSNLIDIAAVSNREALERELGDVRHAMIQLCNGGHVSKAAIHARADRKAEAIGQYLHHQ